MMIYLPQKLQKILTFFKLSEDGDAQKDFNVEIIKNCFAKCGITEENSEDEDDMVDEEFNALFNKLVDSECDMTAKEYIDFDGKTCSSLPAINQDMVD